MGAETGDICCHWEARERLHWCQWIDFIPPQCQKPPAPFCLLSPAADHSEAAALGDTQKDCPRLGIVMITTDEFQIKTVKVDQTGALTYAGPKRPRLCLKLVSPAGKHPVIPAPWIRPSPLTVASKPLEKRQKCDRVTLNRNNTVKAQFTIVCLDGEICFDGSFPHLQLVGTEKIFIKP